MARKITILMMTLFVIMIVSLNTTVANAAPSNNCDNNGNNPLGLPCNVNTTITDLQNQIIILNATITNLQNQIIILNSISEDHITRITSLNSTLDTHSSRIITLEDNPPDLTPLDDRITVLENTPTVDLTPIENDIITLQTLIDSVGNSVETVESNITTLQSQQVPTNAELEISIINNTGKITSLEQNPTDLTPLETRVTTLEDNPTDLTQIETRITDIENNPTDLTPIQTDITNLITANQTQADQINLLQNDFTQTETDLYSISNENQVRLGTVESEIHQVETDVTQLQTDVNSLVAIPNQDESQNTRIDTIESNIINLQSSNSTLFDRHIIDYNTITNQMTAFIDEQTLDDTVSILQTDINVNQKHGEFLQDEIIKLQSDFIFINANQVSIENLENRALTTEHDVFVLQTSLNTLSGTDFQEQISTIVMTQNSDALLINDLSNSVNVNNVGITNLQDYVVELHTDEEEIPPPPEPPIISPPEPPLEIEPPLYYQKHSSQLLVSASSVETTEVFCKQLGDIAIGGGYFSRDSVTHEDGIQLIGSERQPLSSSDSLRESWFFVFKNNSDRDIQVLPSVVCVRY